MSKKKLPEGTYTRESVCNMLNDFYDCLSGKKTLQAKGMAVGPLNILDDDLYKAAVREHTSFFTSQAEWYGLPPQKHGRALWVRHVLSELDKPYTLADLVDRDPDICLAVMLGKRIRQNRLSPNIRNLRKVFGVMGVEMMLQYPYIL